MKSKNINELVEAIAEEITKREDEVFPYVGNNSHVLDQDGLRKAIREALENY